MNILAYVQLRNIYHCTGAGRVARELIENVAMHRDINLHILADQGDHRAIVNKVVHPWRSFQYHLFSSDTSFQQARWIFLQRPAAEAYWPEAHIVHCTTESYVPTNRSRLVVTLHDAAYFDGAHPPSFATLKQVFKWRILYGTLSRSADIFHTVSHFSAERLGHAFPAIRSRLRVIYNAVSPIFFAPCDSSVTQFLEKVNLGGKPFVLLPGGLHYRKNAELVLKAWPLLKECHRDLTLVIAGHNHPDYIPIADSLGSSVVLLGFVEDPYLRALYHGAQAVWFPSRYEGFGIPVLEAMACGAPVVASNQTAIPEISGDAALLVDPGSVDENVQAIDTVVKDPQLRDRLRARGRDRAASFTWAASAAQLHKLYSELI